MSNNSAEHSTIVVLRTYDAPVARVFAAISDPGERMQIYGAGGQQTVVVEQADMSVGGHDVFRFGPGGNPQFRRECIYHDIVPERRIVSSEIVSDGDVRLWIAVTTFEFTPVGERTKLKVTAQIVRLEDAGTTEGAAARYEALLDNLERHLSGNLRFRPRPVTSS
jgi:uncharacterized protein YndB with AHSA1/START domain